MVEPNNAGPSGECLGDIPICGAGLVGGTDAMRCVAWRRWGLEALDGCRAHVCRGPARTAIVHATVMAFHHGCQRSHAALSWPTVTGRTGPRPVIWTRRATMDGCDREGENVRPSARGRGVAGSLRFGSLRLRSRPPRALRRGSRRVNPPRCLKPLPASLEASDRQYRCAENRGFRRQPCAQATPTFRAGHSAAACFADRGRRLIQETGSPLRRGGLGDQVDEAFQEPA
jgi:hypothetical protein